MSKLANPSESNALSCDKDAVRMGLIVDDEPHEAVDIDIIAIHGIHGAANSPWKTRGDATFRQVCESWTKRTVRTITYNYSLVVLSPWEIHHEASKLLNALHALRSDKDGKTGQSRPLMFISNDIGGLIVKAAIIQAALTPQRYAIATTSIRCLVFVACPHRLDGTRYLEDQLTNLLGGLQPPPQRIPTLARNLAESVRDINGNFIQSKVLVSAVLVNVFSTNTNPRDQVFDEYTATMDIPFERRIPSDSTHMKLAESLLNVDHQSYADLSGIACNFWLPKDHSPGTMKLLHTLMHLTSPVYPLEGCSDNENSDIAARICGQEDLINREDSLVLHITCESENQTSLLTKYLVRYINSSLTLNNFVFYFEFQEGDIRFDNVRSLMATLLAQLLHNERQGRFDNIRRILDVPSEYRGWTLEDMIQMWRHYRLTKVLGEVTYVLGGFDKCNDSSGIFLQHLKFIVNETELPIKLIITSTAGKYSNIDKAFVSSPENVYRRRDFASQDLLRLDEATENTTRLTCLFQDNPRLSILEPKLTHLMPHFSGSDGMFQVILQWLRHSSLTLHDVELALDKIHQANPAATLDIILHLIPSERRSWSSRLLSFIATSVRPLSVRELCVISQLCTAVSSHGDVPTLDNLPPLYEQNILKDILEWLGGILVVKNGEIKLAQPSLTTHEHVYQQHLDTLEVCVAYLDQISNSNTPQAFKDGGFQKEQGLGSVDILGPLPYATEHWSRHYDIVATTWSSSSTSHLGSQVRHLLKKESFLEYWGHAYNNIYTYFTEAEVSNHRPDPLSIVAQLGLKDLAQEFIADSSERYHTALFTAARNGHLSVVSILLEVMGKQSMMDWSRFMEAVIGASTCENREVFRVLVKNLTRVPDARPFVSTISPLLFRATWLGLDDVVETLLELGVDPNQTESVLDITPLHIAAEMNHVVTLKRLIAHSGLTINATASHNYKYRPIHIACNYGSLMCVEALLDAEISLAPAEEGGPNTPLFLAVEEGNFNVAEHFLKRDRRASEEKMKEYAFALHRATDMSYYRCIELLLRYGASPNELCSLQESPLQRAIRNHRSDICNLLLKNGANPNDNRFDSSPILDAARQGDNGIVSLLIKYGALVDSSDSSKQTALHIAAGTRQIDVIKTLVDAKANIDAKDGLGFTPLWTAARANDANIVDILATAGANVNVVTEWRNWTPLHVSYDFPEVTQILLKHGADANTLSSSSAPIELAVQFNCVEVVKLLLDNGASTSGSNDYNTPFARAVREGHVEVVEALLDMGADVDQSIGFGHALEYAIRKRSSAMTELILQSSQKLDFQSGQCSRCLSSISYKTPVHSVKCLLRAGADPNIKGKDGCTALCAAIKSSNIDVARYLLYPKVVKWRCKDHHDPKYCSFLYHAVSQSTVEMVRLLVEADQDVHSATALAGTLVAAACYKWKGHDSNNDKSKEEKDNEEKLKITRYLIREAGIRVDTKGGVLGYAINMAAAKCGPDMIRLLIDEGANIAVTDTYGRAPVHLACQNTMATLQALQVPDNDFKKRDKLGRLPLHYAASSGQEDLAREVLNRSRKVGINIEDRDDHGWTPLMWAARATRVWPSEVSETEHHLVIIFLLGEHAHVTVTADGDNNTWTPVDIAIYHCASPDIIQLLTASSVSRQPGERKARGSATENTYCDACLVLIYGYYYECASCHDIVFCFKCYPSRKHVHEDHEWLKLGYEETYIPEGGVSAPSDKSTSDSGSVSDYEDEDILSEDEDPAMIIEEEPEVDTEED